MASYQTNGSVSVSSMVEEPHDQIRQAVLDSVLSGRDMSNNLLEAAIKSIVNTHKRYIKYGDTDFHYGTPSSNVESANPDMVTVQSHLESLHTGSTVNITDSKFGEVDFDTFVFEYLQQNHQYIVETGELSVDNISPVSGTYNDTVEDPLDGTARVTYEDTATTNILTLFSGLSVPDATVVAYSVEYEVVVTETHVTETHETVYTDGVNTETSTQDIETVTFSDGSPTQVINHPVTWTSSLGALGGLVPPITNSTSITNTVTSTILSAPVKKFWTYQVGSGSMPALDTRSDVAYTAKLLPVVPIRLDYSNLITTYGGLNNPAFPNSPADSCNKILDLVGVDLTEISEALDENPDAGVIKDAFFYFASDASGSTQYEMEYAYTFFLKAFGIQSSNTSGGMNQIRVEEDNFRHYVHWSSISKTVVTGNTPNYVTTGDLYSVSVTPGAQQQAWFKFVDSVDYVITKQTSPTEYTEITVSGFVTYYHIKYDTDSVYITPVDYLDADTNQVLLPIDTDILDGMPRRVREEILYKGMKLIIYAFERIKLKWYETGFFANVIKLAGIALSLITLGTSLIASAAISVSAAALTLMKTVLVNLVVDYTIDWIVDELGDLLGDYVVLVRIVGAIVASSASGALDTTKSLADQIMKLTEVVMQSVQESLKDSIMELQEEMESWKDEKEQWEKEIEAVQGLLDRPILSDPMYMLNPNAPVFVLGETPTAFYNRSIHSGNIAVISKQEARNFVASNLRLPK